MAGTDSAFLWETEVLRQSRQTTKPRPVDDIPTGDEWMTLREASQASGVPMSTIRKWVRHDNIPSFLERTPDGNLRIVSMTGIRRWADSIGREIDHTSDIRQPDPDAAGGTEIDLTDDVPTEPQIEVPEGAMLVPLDAWNRMLNQLGNLHEAGQQLAEARERAAKAETEAAFLKERLREIRAEQERVANESDTAEEKVEPTPPTSTVSLLRGIYADWRRGRRRSR